MNTSSAEASVVLVHGGFVDGSGWRAVYDLLTQDGYHVAVVQNPTLSLEGDATAARLIIGAQAGPVVLVGHSYGGAVITEAGTDPKVAALVYIAAFAPDKDESVNTLLAGLPADAPQPPILPPQDGFLFLDRDKFHASFAGDLPAADAAFMADSQVLGRGRPRRGDHRSRLAGQAKLVPAHHPRPDDSPARAARHVRAGRCHHHRGGRQSLCLRVATGRSGRPYQAGSDRDRCAAVAAALPAAPRDG